MTNTQTTPDEADLNFLRRAIRLAFEAEAAGNLPVGAVVTLGGRVVAEAGNAVLAPAYHPGRHAETEALRLVPEDLWPRGREMTIYTTLEPCVMCAGALLLHGVGRVVFADGRIPNPIQAALNGQGTTVRHAAAGRGLPQSVG